MQKTDKTRDHRIKQNKPKSKKANTMFPLIGKIQEREKRHESQWGFVWGGWSVVSVINVRCIRVCKCLPESHYFALIKDIYHSL